MRRFPELGEASVAELNYCTWSGGPQCRGGEIGAENPVLDACTSQLGGRRPSVPLFRGRLILHADGAKLRARAKAGEFG